MLGQIFGTSRILLWNPEQRKNMYTSDLFDIDFTPKFMTTPIGTTGYSFYISTIDGWCKN